MTNRRTPYTDAASTQEMCADCHEVEHNLHLAHRRLDLSDGLGTDLSSSAVARLHSHYEVSEDLARRAGGLELHFD